LRKVKCLKERWEEKAGTGKKIREESIRRSGSESLKGWKRKKSENEKARDKKKEEGR